MKFDPPLQQGIFLKRYKRFFADIEQRDGRVLTVHCPNTGSMKNCLVPGSRCWYSLSDNPNRKLPGTLEMVTTTGGFIAGVNTNRPNYLVEEAIANGVIKQLQGYVRVRREVRYGAEKSRIDLLLDRHPLPECFVEVKNVTMEGEQPGQLLFPDARTERGSKHLRELINMVNQGARAVLVFCVQHSGVETVAPADAIDQQYGATLREAARSGVEILAFRCTMSDRELAIAGQVPVLL